MITEFTRPTFLAPGRANERRPTQEEQFSANAGRPDAPETYRQTKQLLDASEDLLKLIFGPAAKGSSYDR